MKEVETDIVLEKFVFEISSTLKNADLSSEIVLESESIYALADLSQHLRGCLIKINSYQPRHALSSSSKTFFMAIEKLQGGYPSLDSKKEDEESIDWIPADQQLQQWKNITSLKTVPMDLFQVNSFFSRFLARMFMKFFLLYFS